jgi:hypothetical protein
MNLVTGHWIVRVLVVLYGIAVFGALVLIWMNASPPDAPKNTGIMLASILPVAIAVLPSLLRSPNPLNISTSCSTIQNFKSSKPASFPTLTIRKSTNVPRHPQKHNNRHFGDQLESFPERFRCDSSASTPNEAMIIHYLLFGAHFFLTE